MRIVSHLEVPGQNKRERWHWARQRREVQAWAACFKSSLVGSRLLARGRRRVKITSYRKQRFHDEANLVGGCKGLIDGLVRSGLLVDDSSQWASFAYHQETAQHSPVAPGVPCTVVEIEDV